MSGRVRGGVEGRGDWIYGCIGEGGQFWFFKFFISLLLF